ncbi:hypothetical protein LJR044_001681 [Microbacterium foliorum]
MLFAELTDGESAKQWGLAAGLFIVHHRRRHAHGPTFSEVFEHLLPETRGVPSHAVEDWTGQDWYLARHRFRMAVVFAWSRMGYVDYDPGVARSLRPGRRLTGLIERNERIRSLAGEPTPPESKALQRVAMNASLNPEQAVTRLHTTRRFIDRATKAGFLHAVEVADNEVRYPAWRFSPDRNKPVVDGVRLIASSIPAEWTLATIHRFFTTPRAGLKSKRQAQSPVRWLNLGRNPAAIAIILEGYSYDIG